ncbi:Gfo/Idh/MocA family oxidoreductase [Bacillus sp. JJ1521]|uniref:Gfo/Idh/MocA family protein n=1 Tax=Bacillus sp. JJ1521 TaxID=3122957 RepID=UPI002FFEA64B
MVDVKIGMIGLDTSHATAFTKLLNDSSHPFYIGGGKVVMACPVGSPDLELSYSRIGPITKEVEQYGVQIVDTMEDVAENCDAILVESVDGRVHLDQVSKICQFNKPIFVDKPFCLNTAEAKKMMELAERYQTPIMSSSALRFAESLTDALAIKEKGKIIGADCFGPMEIVDTQPGYFWYGIHAIEMLYTILGSGAKHVRSESNKDFDLIVSEWEDGRFCTARGNRKGNGDFGAVIHFEKGTEYVLINSSSKPFYASLLKQVLEFFKDGKTRVPLHETLEIIRFIESANESRETGKVVYL